MTAEDYVDRVAFELHDLPWTTRRELVAELRAHLGELPDGTDLVARLGPPEQYAADLRTAAGLDRRHGPIAFLRARRPRNLILTVVVLVVMGLGIGAVVWVDSYQPLALGSSGQDPAGAVQAPAGDSESVVFRDGRPFRFGVSIRNTGSFTVRIVGVPLTPGLPVSTRLLMSGPLYRGGTAAPFRFHPFDLKPGEERFLLLQGVYAHCSAWGPSTVTGLDSLPVRYSFLWRTATADIPLFEKLAIVFPKKLRCR